MFETIQKLRPYFFSFREIDDKACLDLKIPVTWVFDGNNNHIAVQDRDERFYLITIYNDITEKGYDELFELSLQIVQYNISEEEKKNLLQEKIKELESLFKTESLDKLKEINF